MNDLRLMMKFLKLYILSLGVLVLICLLFIIGPAGIIAGLPVLLAAPAYAWLNQRDKLYVLEERNEILEKHVGDLEERVQALEQERGRTP